ncbi:MAG TPA: hypothetical protein PKL77_08770 [Candidatus Omnitrophota bacterium]|nr:hypothetical protein [Candidatus Omnitrophota bacterium]HPT07429.1 hypothetical protein [Candidatus Omnitrophota bacterium]
MTLKNGKKVARAVLLVFFAVAPVFAGDSTVVFSVGSSNAPSAPRLLYPLSDSVILTGKDSLEFRWWNEGAGIDHFIFKIYKGYAMYGQDLLYKQNVPSGLSSITIQSKMFENGRVYTWSLIQVSFDGLKSDKSFSAFKVIKE